MKPERRKRLLLILAACGLGLVLLDSLVVRPLLASWDSQAERIAKSSQEIERGTALLERGDDVAARWKRMRDASLPSDTARAEATVLDAIGQWSDTSGLAVSAIRPRWIEMKNVGDRFEIRLSGEGNMASVARFMYELESTDLPVSLAETQIRSLDNSGGKLAVELLFSALRVREAGK